MTENNNFPKDIIQKLQDNSEEINLLKEKISILETQNNKYQNKILDLNLQIKELVKTNIENCHLIEQKKNYEKKIESLEKEIIDITSNIKEENRQIENQLENEVVFYKGMQETGMAKVDAADNIIKLNHAQNKYIIDLEKELDKLKNDGDATVCKLKIEHDLHFYNLKKKMMDYVKEISHNMAQNNKDNLELNSKLDMIYKNQMLNELEHQAIQIKELLKIKEKYKKIIFELKQELNLHKKVEKTVVTKNMKFENIIKEYDKNILNKSNSLFLYNTNKKKEKMPLSEKKQKKKNHNSLENDKNEELLKAQLTIVDSILNSNHYRECYAYKNNKYRFNKKYYNEYISLKKLYDELLKENQSIKEKLTTMKDKQKMYNDKFSGILKMYKNALDELISDEELKNMNINITKEIINSGNYDSFTKEQKQMILKTLIKELLPLSDINKDNNDIDSLKNSLQQSFNFKTSTTLSSKKGEGSSRNNISKLTKLNFRSVLDNKISICENNNKHIFRNNKGINSLKTLNNDKNVNLIKINEFAKDKIDFKNKSSKLFKCINENNNKPLRFFYLKNKFNIDYDLKSPVDTCLTKNNFFS